MKYLEPLKSSAVARGLLLFGLALIVAVPTLRAESVADKVVVIPITNETLIQSQELYQLGQVLDKVKLEKARAVVFDLNANEGDPIAAAKLVREKVATIGIPVVAWVNPAATGAGAVFAIGSDAIAMSALGTIG